MFTQMVKNIFQRHEEKKRWLPVGLPRLNYKRTNFEKLALSPFDDGNYNTSLYYIVQHRRHIINSLDFGGFQSMKFLSVLLFFCKHVNILTDYCLKFR